MSLLRGIFEQLAVGNGRPLIDAMADECRWVFPGNWSWAGTWEPKREIVTGLLRPLMAQFESYRLTEIVEHCDTALVERVLDPVR